MFLHGDGECMQCQQDIFIDCVRIKKIITTGAGNRIAVFAELVRRSETLLSSKLKLTVELEWTRGVLLHQSLLIGAGMLLCALHDRRAIELKEVT